MILEAFITSKLIQKHNEHQKLKERFSKGAAAVGVASGLVIFWAILWIANIVLWIISIVSAARCPKPNIGEVVIAIFIWPLYWILKWTGTMCKGKK